MSEKTVTVQGTVYDKRTGMPLHVERSGMHSKSAQQVHRSVQKSITLNRRYVKRDTPRVVEQAAAPKAAVHHAVTTHRKVTPPVTISRPEAIKHFTPHQVAKSTARPTMRDIAPTPHALAINASRKLAKPQVHTAVKPSQVLKQEAIAKAMAQTPTKRDRKEVNQPRSSKARRRLSMAAASIAVLLLGSYLTYLSMPSISTRVAASQAGIAASYPSYQPTGYALNGPVAYQQGRVTMTFAAHAGPASYTLDQVKSGWDSSAVLDSYVKPNAGDDYQTTTSNGLTIYTYGSNAAWVNRGIFYTITGNAPLSDEQIQHIATSL